MLSLQPTAPQQAKATAAIDILFIEGSLVCVEAGRPAPGKQPGRALTRHDADGSERSGEAVLQLQNVADSKR
jgi:hypothetical protein